VGTAVDRLAMPEHLNLIVRIDLEPEVPGPAKHRLRGQPPGIGHG